MLWLKRKVVHDYHYLLQLLYKGKRGPYNHILDMISAIEYGPNEFLEKALLMHG